MLGQENSLGGELRVKVTAARVPIALLTDSSLTASAKVVWMVFRLNTPLTAGEKPFAARIAMRIGLSKETVRKALIQLSRSQWNPLIVASSTGPTRAKAAPAPKHPARLSAAKDRTVRAPAELLFDGSLSAEARVLYGLVQAVPGFRHPSGESTYAEIACLAGKDTRTVRRAIRELVWAGWLAWQFIKFVITSTKVDAYYHGARRIPIYRPLAENPDWLEAQMTPNKQIFIQSVATGEPLEFRPNWGEWHSARGATLRPSWLGQVSVEQGLRNWAQAIENAIQD